MKAPVVALLIPMVLGLLASSLHAQAPLHQSNLPGVKPEALQQLSDNRVRQHIIRKAKRLIVVVASANIRPKTGTVTRAQADMKS